MKVKVNTFWLWLVYCAMIVLCVYLTMNSDADMRNIIINISLFLLTGVIFFFSSINLRKIVKIREDLVVVIRKINVDHLQNKDMLIDQYLNSKNGNIFPISSNLHILFEDYLREMKRVNTTSEGYSKCDINDYFNYEYIDSVARKNVLNNVAGALTGLGILGTFIGLTIGLQDFSTGTTAEIEQGIPVLMNGIKIAFHTSIYGMVFSLFFNYIYKAIMESAYENMDGFLRTFNLYVCSDIETDNESNLQKSIGLFIEEFKTSVYESFIPIFTRMADSLDVMQKDIELQPKAVGEQMSMIITPEIDKLNQSLDKFAGSVASSQREELSALVDKFVEMMNQSLGDNFVELGTVISNTAAMQGENNKMLKAVMSRIKEVSENIVKVNELSEATINSMSSYIAKIEGLQNVIGENFMNVNIQLEDQQKYDEIMKGYIDDLVKYEKDITTAVSNFSSDMSAQLKAIGVVQDEIAKHTDENLKMLSENSINYSNKITEAAENNIKHISTTTKDIADNAIKCTEKVSDVTEKAISRVLSIKDDNIEGLNKATDSLKDATEGLKNAVNKTNEDVVDSLNNILNQFDKELEKMIQHLSGTLTSMNSTVKNVPAYVRQTLEDMDTVFNSLNDKLEELNKMVESIKDKDSDNKKK